MGRVTKISDGPLSGETPTDAAAGNIIKPAKIAITVSRTAICAEDFNRFVLRLK